MFPPGETAALRFTRGTVEHQTRDILRAWGVPPDLADITAAAVVDADLAGIDSHGVSMLPTYETMRETGELAVTARTRLVRQTTVTALLDAGAGFGHPAGVTAMQLAADKAAEHGVAVVSVRNSHHFGAAGYYAALAADRNLIGLVTTSARSVCVVPTRGREPRLGTNPLAFAAPARRNPPFVLDMSTSTVAVNKVKVYGYADAELPGTWVRDGDGTVVTGPHEAMQVIRGTGAGGLTPLGGTAEMASHKGYGLGMMVQVLSATLAGAGFPAGRGPDGPQDVGHFFLALDPGAFRDDGDFRTDLDDAMDLLRGTRPENPALPVLVAGDVEAAARAERTRHGIPVPDVLRRQLHDVCRRAGARFLLDDTAARNRPA